MNTVVDTADTRFSLRLSSSLFIFPCFLCPPFFVLSHLYRHRAYRSRRVSIGRVRKRREIWAAGRKIYRSSVLRKVAANSPVYNGIVKQGKRGFREWRVIRRVIDPALDRLESSTKRTYRGISSLHRRYESSRL